MKIRPDVVVPMIDKIGETIFEFMEMSENPMRIWAMLKILNGFFLGVDMLTCFFDIYDRRPRP